jgi:hydrogenase-4 component B
MPADVLSTIFIGLGLLAASAVLSPLVAKKRRMAGIVNLVLTAAAAAVLIAASVPVISGAAGHVTRTLQIGPIAVPFLVDGFAALFVVIIAFMSVMSALYSVRYMDHYPEYGLGVYYLCLPLFILGMIGLVTVDDLAVGFTVSWQIMTVASYFLIRFESGKKGIVRNANKYLALMELAWLLVTVGAFFAEGYHFGDSLSVIAGRLAITGGPALAAFFGLLLVGFGMKAGVFPLGQLWLPDAHSIAPSPVSALLSGVMLKTGIYGLMRTFLFLAPAGSPAFDGKAWGLGIAAIGAVTLFIGTLQSVKQSDSKRLLAYSSIGQIGYIVLAVGAALLLGLAENPALEVLAVVAAVGALYHVLNHAIFKGLLFLSSGSVLYATGTKDLNKLGGLINLMPASAAVAGIASLAISGMPPMSGFMSKWSIISSSLLAGAGAPALVLFGIAALFTSVVTLACYVKFFGMTFTASGTQWTVAKKVREVPASMLVPKFILAAVCIVQGLLPFVFYKLIASVFTHSEGFLLADGVAAAFRGGPLSAALPGIRMEGLYGIALNSAAAPLAVFVVLGLALGAGALLRRSAGSKEVEAKTWLCGYQDLNEANRYTDRGMFAALKGLFRWTGGK